MISKKFFFTIIKFCPYWKGKAVVLTQMIEKREKIAKIFEIDEETMESMLNFIYTGEILITKKNVKEILKASDYFQIKSLFLFVF